MLSAQCSVQATRGCGQDMGDRPLFATHKNKKAASERGGFWEEHPAGVRDAVEASGTGTPRLLGLLIVNDHYADTTLGKDSIVAGAENGAAGLADGKRKQAG